MGPTIRGNTSSSNGTPTGQSAVPRRRRAPRKSAKRFVKIFFPYLGKLMSLFNASCNGNRVCSGPLGIWCWHQNPLRGRKKVVGGGGACQGPGLVCQVECWRSAWPTAGVGRGCWAQLTRPFGRRWGRRARVPPTATIHAASPTSPFACSFVWPLEGGTHSRVITSLGLPKAAESGGS